MVYRVITIDGPAGSGKSTVASKLAAKLGFLHLNSGALYRAVGIEAEALGLNLNDNEAVGRLVSELQFDVIPSPDGVRVSVNERDVTDLIAGEHAGSLASQVATLPRVREALTKVQRRIGECASLVLEGRDAGTVVFPRADAKFYLDASFNVRAERRFREAVQPGVTLDQVRTEIAERDRRDSTRAVAPHERAEDAVLIDTSNVDADEVVETMIVILRQRGIIERVKK